MTDLMINDDPGTRNVDVDNGNLPIVAKETGYKPTPEETLLVRKWFRKIKISRAFDENIRKMYARDRRYARGETGMDVSYSLIQAYIDILCAFLVARDPDVDCPPGDSVGQEGLGDAEVYGKTMEIVVKHLFKSSKLKRKASRWVRSALTVGIGVLKASWQEVWGQDPHIRARLKDAQENVAQIRALMERIQSGETTDMEGALAQLKHLQDGLAGKSEVLIASGMALDLIRPEDMAYSVDYESVVDTDEGSWLGNRYFLEAEDLEAEFQSLDAQCVRSATLYGPRKPRDKNDKEAKVNGVVGDVSDTESDAFVKGGGGDKTNVFACCWEIWDARTETFFTIVEGVSDRWANPPQPPPCPTTKFDPYFLLSFTEIDGERHPQSLITRSNMLQDEIERAMTQFIEHRKRIKPKLGFDASKVTRDTITRLKNGTSEEYVAIRLLAGAAEGSDLSKILFPITYTQIDMAIYSVEPIIRAMETVWGIQEALTSTVQVAKTATEADIQQAGTQAKTGFKRDILEAELTNIAVYYAECASYRMSRKEVQIIAGPGAFWIENASAEDLHTMIKLEIRAGSTGKPDNAARRDAWAAVQPQIKELMLLIADLRQTQPPQLADNLEQLLIETAERMGEQLNAKRFVPQLPEMVAVGPDGRPMTNTQMQAQQEPQPGATGEGGDPPADSGQATPPNSGQERLAPTALPPAIAG